MSDTTLRLRLVAPSCCMSPLAKASAHDQLRILVVLIASTLVLLLRFCTGHEPDLTLANQAGTSSSRSVSWWRLRQRRRDGVGLTDEKERYMNVIMIHQRALTQSVSQLTLGCACGTFLAPRDHLAVGASDRQQQQSRVWSACVSLVRVTPLSLSALHQQCKGTLAALEVGIPVAWRASSASVIVASRK